MSISNDFQKLAKEEAMHRAVYLRLAKSEKNQELRDRFLKLATFDSKHAKVWSSISGEKHVGFSNMKATFFLLIRYLFGAAFAIKLLERGERKTILSYEGRMTEETLLGNRKNEVREVINDELDKEASEVDVIRKKTGNYLGPVVLGLNDALVELIGVIAGLVSAISSNLFIGFSGLVVGIASAFSMAASYYLSSDFSEGSVLKSLKGGLYTGGSYFVTSLLLVMPFFVSGERFVALGFSLGFAVSIICLISFYNAVVNDRPFGKNLAKMLLLGLGVALAVYFISEALSAYFGIQV